jgi:Ca2+-binding RTX toxin-like protein
MAEIITNGSKSGHIDGTDESDTIKGKGGDDQIGGHKGDDLINGGIGNDHVHGGGGNDMLTGGKGEDVFVFKEFGKAYADTVTDFKHGVDSIGIDAVYFTALNDGTLNDGEFFLGTKAHDGDDHLIYDKGTGRLYYDDDGNGAHKQQLIATFENHAGKHPTISDSDFNIFFD